MRFTSLLVLCLAAAPFAAAANCKDPQSQAEINGCSWESYEKADRELNASYQKLLKQLDAPNKEKLKIAQRAWIQFRDAHCALEAESAAGGSMQPMVESGCLEDVTRARTKQLRELSEEF